MSESAVRYLSEPDPITDLILKNGGGFLPYHFRVFLAEYVVPRIPNTTTEQNAIVQRVISMITGETNRWEVREAVWKAIAEGLPQFGDRKEPAIKMPVYMKVQPFYAAVFGAPDTEPKDWGQVKAAPVLEPVAQAAE